MQATVVPPASPAGQDHCPPPTKSGPHRHKHVSFSQALVDVRDIVLKFDRPARGCPYLAPTLLVLGVILHLLVALVLLVMRRDLVAKVAIFSRPADGAVKLTSQLRVIWGGGEPIVHGVCGLGVCPELRFR